MLSNLACLCTYFSWYPHLSCERLPHGVSGICQELPTKRGEIAGQMFDSIREIRWKKQKSAYEILILSQQELNLAGELNGLEKLAGTWKTREQDAHWYDPQEARFPKGFTFKDRNNQSIEPKEIPIKQRYFQDSATATIHFIALTVPAND